MVRLGERGSQVLKKKKTGGAILKKEVCTKWRWQIGEADKWKWEGREGLRKRRR